MKYIVVLGDGMADQPIPELGDKTPLELSLIHISTVPRNYILILRYDVWYL